MRDFLNNNQSALADFRDLYNKHYAHQHDHKLEERLKKITQK